MISNANLVVYSDVPHYITTSTTGEILVGNLERGNHEIYHINDTLANIKKMTKEQIKTKALTSAIFTTSDENILFTNNSSISSSIISNKTYCSEIEGKVYEFDYTGGEQELLTICEGTYRLETWGASGGNANATYIGGYGGYSVGNMFLNKETNLYINVGGKGSGGPVSSNWTTYSGGYNGGGTTKWYEVNVNIASGGGATHISDVPGTLDKLESYKGIYSAVDETYLSENIFIVSGGGGGAYWIVNGQNGMGGSGGGHIANPGTSTYNKVIPATGGTQTSGGIRGDWGLNKGLNGLFGKSGDCSLNGGIGGGACAGGGFYGGGTSSWGGAGGGSSYIGNPLLTNKAMYCYDCLESTKEATRTIKVKEFSAKPEANKAKQGNGYAKITYLG